MTVVQDFQHWFKPWYWPCVKLFINQNGYYRLNFRYIYKLVFFNGPKPVGNVSLEYINSACTNMIITAIVLMEISIVPFNVSLQPHLT